MKKQVTFIVQEPSGPQGCRGQTWQSADGKSLATRQLDTAPSKSARQMLFPKKERSAGLSYYQTQKYTTPERRTDQIFKSAQKKGEITTALQQLCTEPQIKKVHIPKSMMTSPFLKHPDLTMGQKRYLCSIAKIYSTRYMQTLINREYLTGYHRQAEHYSRKCTVCIKGFNACRENQFKAQYLHKQHSQSETWKNPPNRLALLPSSSMAQDPAEKGGKLYLPQIEHSKQRLQSGELLKARNTSEKTLRSRKRKTTSEKGFVGQLGSSAAESTTEQALMNESMNSMSIVDEQEEGVTEQRWSSVNEQKEEQASKNNSISIENEEETETTDKTIAD